MHGAGHPERLRGALPQGEHALPRMLRAGPNVRDQGAKMVSAISSVIDSQDPDEINRILDQIPDPVGTFYRFSIPGSMLHRKQTGTRGR